MIDVIQIKGHAEDCYAIKAVERGTWNSPWFLDTYKGLAHIAGNNHANLRGRPSDSVRWLRMRCNCTHCKAELLIRVDIIEDLAEIILGEEASDD